MHGKLLNLFFTLTSAVCLLLSGMTQARSGGLDGEKLYTENCLACHDSTIHTRENRIVNSFPALKSRIKQCELSNELAWFEEEIDAVANYLNNNFYHFE